MPVPQGRGTNIASWLSKGGMLAVLGLTIVNSAMIWQRGSQMPSLTVTGAAAVGNLTVTTNANVYGSLVMTERNAPADTPAANTQFWYAGTNVQHAKLSNGSIKVNVWKDPTTGVIEAADGSLLTNLPSSGGGTITSTHNAAWTPTFSEQEVTLSTSGVTTTVTSFLPANSRIESLGARVTEATDGATSKIDIGVSGDTARFVDDLGVTLGATATSWSQTSPLASYMNGSLAVDLKITVDAAPTSTGKVRVCVFYATATAPTD